MIDFLKAVPQTRHLIYSLQPFTLFFDKWHFHFRILKITWHLASRENSPERFQCNWSWQEAPEKLCQIHLPRTACYGQFIYTLENSTVNTHPCAFSSESVYDTALAIVEWKKADFKQWSDISLLGKLIRSWFDKYVWNTVVSLSFRLLEIYWIFRNDALFGNQY